MLLRHNVPLVLLGLGLAACVTRGDLEEIKENQKKILEKMDRTARAPARPQRPAQPDRNKTYAMPVGKSAIIGPKDAWVTIVEVSDFQ